MRPITLTMKAFGSYRDTVVVPFDCFRNELYLITGKTGAGKTTIFDGIMFSLFGEASARQGGNSGEDNTYRNKKMLHSSFAPLSTDTEVTLDFESDGRAYRVHRTIHYSKKRYTDNEYNEADFDASLTGDGIEPVNNSGAVSKEIERIIGMNAVQFRQIIMLAQGEFLNFICAKDEERKKILSRLFDSSLYENFQLLLKAANKQIQDRDTELGTQVGNALAGELFPLPENASDEERAKYTAENPDLLIHMAELIKNETAMIASDEEKWKALESAYATLIGRREKAVVENKALDELDQALATKGKFDAEAGNRATREARFRRVEKAWHVVRPAAELLRVKTNEIANSESRERSLGEELRSAESAKKETEKESALEPERRKTIDELKKKNHEIEALYPDYDRLSEASADVKKHTLSEVTAETAIQAAKTAIDAIGLRQKEIDKTLESLESVEEELQQAVLSLKEVTETYVTVTDKKNGVLHDIDALKIKEAEYVSLYGVTIRLEKLRHQAEEHYGELHLRFLADQAGVLAEALEAEILEKGRAACPVCRTPFIRGHQEVFALRAAETPSQDEVESAEQAMKRAQERYSEKKQELASLEAMIASERSSCLLRASSLLDPVPEWSELRKSEVTTAALEALEARKTAAEKREAELRKKSNEKKKLLDEKESLVKKLADSRQAEADAENRKTRAVTEKSNAQKIVSELSEKLKQYADREAAEKAATENTAQATALENKITDARTRADSAGERVNRLSGQLESIKKLLEEQRGELPARQAAFSDSLMASGFADEAAYLEAAALAGEDGEAWLTAEKSDIDDVNERVRTNIVKVEELQESTKDYLRTDIPALDEQIDAADKARAGAGELLKDKKHVLKLHRTAEERIRDLQAQRKKLIAAKRRARKLSDIANGTNNGNGKRAFDGYVLGSYFDEMLRYATLHLEAMSGGHYELHHKEEANRSNTGADFLINVLDRVTGQTREIGSLSGGEKFQASMALALGLSDVAQAHASGGRKIESMFIDEGFGSLDDTALTDMISVLHGISRHERQIGIISHVDDLEGQIDKKIEVYQLGEQQGSAIKIIQ